MVGMFDSDDQLSELADVSRHKEEMVKGTGSDREDWLELKNLQGRLRLTKEEFDLLSFLRYRIRQRNLREREKIRRQEHRWITIRERPYEDAI